MTLTKDEMDLLVGVFAPHAEDGEVRKNPNEYLSRLLSAIMNNRSYFTVRGIIILAAQEAAREVVRKNSMRKTKKRLAETKSKKKRAKGEKPSEQSSVFDSCMTIQDRLDHNKVCPPDPLRSTGK